MSKADDSRGPVLALRLQLQKNEEICDDYIFAKIIEMRDEERVKKLSPLLNPQFIPEIEIF